MSGGELLTAVAVAQKLGVSVKTVRRLVARGELDAYVVGGASGRGGRLRIDPASVERYLQDHRAGAAPHPPRKSARRGRLAEIINP